MTAVEWVLMWADMHHAPRIGSLFSGYGGLEMGVQQVLGGSVAWHVEYDAAPSKVLAHHHPDVPNYGDIATVDWSAVERGAERAIKRLGLDDGKHAVCVLDTREA